MAVEDSLDIFGSDPFGRDYLYGLSTGRDGQGLAPYGTRYAESVNQPTTAKGRGYLGNVGTMQDPMTELSASSDFGGRTVRYPLIVPTLTADELNLLRSGGEPTQEIYGKAQQYALGRLSRGQDPFATTQELRYPQPQAVDTRPYDQMQATPRGFTSGLFSDVLSGTLNMPSMPRTGIPALDLLYMNRNPVLNMMGVGDVQKTSERISYGQPLTTGQGMTLRPREEAVFAGMAVAPFVGEAVNLGTRAGRAGAKMVGERIAENVVMGRPNLPSMLAEPRSSLFAVEPNPSMAAADESSAMRQQLTGKMQALLAQKKVATSAVEVGAINQQISELQAQFKSLPAVGRVAREVVAPQITAPVSDLGFYSAAEQAAMNLERSKGTGQSFLNDLMNAPDVKKDELSWIGLDDFLKDKPNVTKQEVQDFIASNKIDLQEVRLGESPIEDPIGIAQRKAVFDKYEPQIQALYKDIDSFGYNTPREVTQSTDNRLRALQQMRDAEADAFYKIPEPAPTKYQKYQLAGGENYREILLKMPEKTRPVSLAEVNAERAKISDKLEPLTQTEYDALVQSGEVNQISIGGGKYQSSHFDEPNILAHIRVNDRVDADGKKMLLVEEIQSDWHQAGREKGYKGKGTLKELPDNYFVQEVKTIDGDTMYVVRDNSNPSVIINKDYNRQSAINGVINELNASSAGGVPDAPFKDTWYQLSLKRILKYAADNGYERVGLTTGKQQVDRYKMSNEVNSLAWRDAGGGVKRAVSIDLINGDNMTLSVNSEGKLMGGDFKDKSLSSVLGKDLAKKIMSEDSGNLMGNGLNIGGEGMKAYYDEIYPKFLEKYGKKWDAGVGETKVNTVKERAENSMIPIMGQEPVRYIDITPKMKEGVKKGQPLAAAEQTPEMLASGSLDYADPFKNPLLESTIG